MLVQELEGATIPPARVDVSFGANYPVGVTRARARARQRVVLTSTPWDTCLDSASVREPGRGMIGAAGKHRAGAI